MREIKFRAWDKEQNKMLKVTQLDFADWWVQCGYDKFGVGERNSFKNEDTDRFILEQFTGLHDKNGVEVYEGDLVDASWYDSEEPISDVCGEVRYNQNLCSFCIWDKEDETMSEMNGKGAYAWEIEVIGNIHERSE